MKEAVDSMLMIVEGVKRQAFEIRSALKGDPPLLEHAITKALRIENDMIVLANELRRLLQDQEGAGFISGVGYDRSNEFNVVLVPKKRFQVGALVKVTPLTSSGDVAGPSGEAGASQDDATEREEAG